MDFIFKSNPNEGLNNTAFHYFVDELKHQINLLNIHEKCVFFVYLLN